MLDAIYCDMHFKPERTKGCVSISGAVALQSIFKAMRQLKDRFLLTVRLSRTILANDRGLLVNVKKYMWMHHVFSSIILCFLSIGVLAETRIAILDFELKDLTMDPRIPEEIKRTASIKQLLEAELKKANYVIIGIDPESQEAADNGVGYLFNHNGVAANLGKQFGADYVLVGRLHKPSFLFVYLMGHLIRVSDAELIGNYVVESKGSNQKLTAKAVESLAVKIDTTLDNRYSPPSN